MNGGARVVRLYGHCRSVLRLGRQPVADTMTVEHHIRIYDDKHGWYVTVRPDRDGCGTCEIAWNDGDQQFADERTLPIPWPMARLMATAILGLPTDEETARA